MILGMLFGKGLRELSRKPGRRSASQGPLPCFRVHSKTKVPNDNREAYLTPDASNLMMLLVAFFAERGIILPYGAAAASRRQ